jgi:hypothetical protein
VQFALAPALVSNDIIDYSTPTGQKLYNRAVLPLTPAFDTQPANLKGFLERVYARAMSTGWMTILEIPPDLNEPDEVKNLAKDYGQLTLEQVMAHAATYINGQSRAAQESMQLYLCLLESLTKEALDKVMLSSEEFTVHDLPSGTGLLRVIIRESGIDTNATTSFIRARLSSLDKYMTSVKSDVEKFDIYVQTQMAALNSRGARTEDLLTNLFKGYMAASDKEFRTYINTHQEEYFDGANLTPKALMQLALNKYKTLVEAERWNAPSDEEIKIIALEAKVEKMSKENKATKQTTSTGTNKSTKKASGDGTKVNKKKDKPAWVYKKPKDGEPKTKTVEGKEWHWCPKHEAWGAHLASACLGKGVRPPKKGGNKAGQEQSSTQANDAGGTSANATLQLTQALAALHESA